MSFSPVEASKHITDKYYRYLKTIFKIGQPYSDEFEHLIDDSGSFASGPFLDVTDAFELGKSIRNLVDEDVLPKSFLKINIFADRPLYKHQELAIRKLLTKKRNLVVSTGTGSGKTESFFGTNT